MRHDDVVKALCEHFGNGSKESIEIKVFFEYLMKVNKIEGFKADVKWTLSFPKSCGKK